jgi:hypothetical protein
MKKIIFASAFLLTMLNAGDVKPIIQVGYQGGGDRLITIAHPDRNYGINGGDGISIEGGMALDNPHSNLEFQALVGYRVDADNADNGDVTWDTVPLSLLALYKADNWKFGGGLTYHLAPQLDGGFGGDVINDDYEDAVGSVAQIQYAPSEAFAIGLRATFIEYELKSDPTKKTSGNNIGIIGTVKFGTDYDYR